MGFIIKVFLLLVSWMLYILKSIPCTDVIRVGSIPSTAGVILGLGRILSCPGAFAFSKGKLKGDFNPVYLTQFVLSFNNYESFFCASPVLGIKNTAVYIGAPNPCAHRVHLWGEVGTTKERSKVNMMLDGRRVYQEEGLAGRARRCRGHGGRAGVEREEPCCFRAGLQVQRTPRSLKQEDRHILGNWGGDGPPIDSSPADTRGHGPPRAEYGGGSLPPVESGPFPVPRV